VGTGLTWDVLPWAQKQQHAGKSKERESSAGEADAKAGGDADKKDEPKSSGGPSSVFPQAEDGQPRE